MPDTAAIKRRIDELAAEVQRLNDAYYGKGDSPLPDAEYDALKDELAALVAEHPELEPADSPLGKVNAPVAADRPDGPPRAAAAVAGQGHDRGAGAHVLRPLPRARRFRVSEKLDGLSLSVVYQDGTLDYVATRGTGAVGELVTDKVAPRHPGPAGRRSQAKGRVEVRGEAVMLRSTWARLQRGAPRQDPDQPAQRRRRAR